MSKLECIDISYLNTKENINWAKIFIPESEDYIFASEFLVYVGKTF